ncbi:MAG: hypothetical protein ACOC4E_02075 [Patescibacteria group bacterium]
MESIPKTETPQSPFELNDAQLEALADAIELFRDIQQYDGEILSGERYQEAERCARALTEALQDPLVRSKFEYQQLQERMTAAANGHWQRPSEVAAAQQLAA